MSGFRIFVLIVGGILLLLFLVGLALPADYEVTRTVEVKAPKSEVLDSLLNLDTWPDWSPWRRYEDDNLKFTTTGQQGMAGYTLKWEGEHVGTGQVKITQVSPVDGIGYEMESGDQSLVQYGTINLEDAPEGTTVTWTVKGHLGANPIVRWMGLLIDGSLGPEYEKALQEFKGRVEQ